MPEEMRPASKKDAPDPSHSYERSHPSRESSTGRLDSPKPVPQRQPDSTQAAVKNKTDSKKQINAHDTEIPEQEQLPNQPKQK